MNHHEGAVWALELRHQLPCVISGFLHLGSLGFAGRRCLLSLGSAGHFVIRISGGHAVLEQRFASTSTTSEQFSHKRPLKLVFLGLSAGFPAKAFDPQKGHSGLASALINRRPLAGGPCRAESPVWLPSRPEAAPASPAPWAPVPVALLRPQLAPLGAESAEQTGASDASSGTSFHMPGGRGFRSWTSLTSRERG